MNDEEIGCGICWRAANLSPAQQADPANAITGTIRRCAKHQALHDEISALVDAVPVVTDEPQRCEHGETGPHRPVVASRGGLDFRDRCPGPSSGVGQP